MLYMQGQLREITLLRWILGMLLILLHEERVVHVLIVGHIEQQHIKQLAIETRVSLGLLENLAKLKQ